MQQRDITLTRDLRKRSFSLMDCIIVFVIHDLSQRLLQ
jgi:hypothetical protein